MLRIPIIAILICGVLSMSYAQDSAKKRVAVKPNPVYKTYKYHSYRSRADSLAKAAQKRDTTPPAKILSTKSLGGQYQYLLSKVYYHQQPLVSALWKNVSDTLKGSRLKLKDAQNKLAVQNKAIDSLKADAASRAQSLSARIDEVDVLGILLSKTTYNLIVWGLVGLFGLTALVVIARSGSFRREARYRTQLYNELEEEFKTYKTKANDKEKKLARELQTERNKLDDLLGRG
jgi:hypothetical protein